MTFTFIQDVPANEEIYAQIRAELGDETPAGLIVHLAVTREGGLRYIDVWESEEAWVAFRESRVEPAVGKVLASLGIPRPAEHPQVEPLHTIDVWLGAGVALAR